MYVNVYTNNTKISKDFLLFLLGPLMDLNKQNKITLIHFCLIFYDSWFFRYELRFKIVLIVHIFGK